MATKKSAPSWSDVKTKLANMDRAGLLTLVQDLYAASKDNRNFLHARFRVGDVLGSYKAIIARWLWPDVFKNQDYSVAKAKKPISDFRKAIGQAEGLAELMVFYCEQAHGFSDDVGLDDDSYYDSLVRMFDLALKVTMMLPEAQREPFLDRLEVIRAWGQGMGWGLDEDFNASWLKAGLEIDA
jgi:hypothetical protein